MAEGRVERTSPAGGPRQSLRSLPGLTEAEARRAEAVVREHRRSFVRVARQQDERLLGLASAEWAKAVREYREACGRLGIAGRPEEGARAPFVMHLWWRWYATET